MNESNSSANSNETYYYGYYYGDSSSCYSYETSSRVASALGCLGVLTDVISIVVFSQKTMRKNTMNTYLLAKSASSLPLMISNALYPWFTSYSSYGLLFLELFFFYYICWIAQLSSIMLEVMAAFDRYVFISNNLIFYRKIDHRIIILVIFILSFAFHVYVFFILHVVEFSHDSSGGGEIVYVLITANDRFYFIFALINSLLRDVFLVAVLIIFNVLILVEMRRAMAKKRTISRSHSNQASYANSKADRAERNITIMVVFSGVTYVVCRIPDIINALPFELAFVASDCFIDISIALGILSYSNSLVFYVSFNSAFRETLLKLIKTLIGKIYRRKPSKSNSSKNITRTAHTL